VIHEERAEGPSTRRTAESTRERRFLSALPEIESALLVVARRHRLTGSEAEEFASEAKLRFIEDSYAVLDRFQGRSSLRTYLVTVIHRIYLDYRRARWGKWRPSAAAIRLGETAVHLEALI
jgi:RNA polymerase sigma factor for flagellar operon FliA